MSGVVLRWQVHVWAIVFVRIKTRIIRATRICSALLAFSGIRRSSESSFVHLAQGTVLDRCVSKLPGLFCTWHLAACIDIEGYVRERRRMWRRSLRKCKWPLCAQNGVVICARKWRTAARKPCSIGVVRGVVVMLRATTSAAGGFTWHVSADMYWHAAHHKSHRAYCAAESKRANRGRRN